MELRKCPKQKPQQLSVSLPVMAVIACITLEFEIYRMEKEGDYFYDSDSEVDASLRAKRFSRNTNRRMEISKSQ